VEKACALQGADEANSQRLSRKAAEMFPQGERSVENDLCIRDQIKAKMLKVADEVMDEGSGSPPGLFYCALVK